MEGVCIGCWHSQTWELILGSHSEGELGRGVEVSRFVLKVQFHVSFGWYLSVLGFGYARAGSEL